MATGTTKEGNVTECEVDFRDNDTVWIWLGSEGDAKIEMTKSEVFELVKSFVFMDADWKTQEMADKMLFDVKMAIWEGVAERSDNFN